MIQWFSDRAWIGPVASIFSAAMWLWLGLGHDVGWWRDLYMALAGFMLAMGTYHTIFVYSYLPALDAELGEQFFREHREQIERETEAAVTSAIERVRQMNPDVRITEEPPPGRLH